MRRRARSSASGGASSAASRADAVGRRRGSAAPATASPMARANSTGGSAATTTPTISTHSSGCRPSVTDLLVPLLGDGAGVTGQAMGDVERRVAVRAHPRRRRLGGEGGVDGDLGDLHAVGHAVKRAPGATTWASERRVCAGEIVTNGPGHEGQRTLCRTPALGPHTDAHEERCVLHRASAVRAVPVIAAVAGHRHRVHRVRGDRGLELARRRLHVGHHHGPGRLRRGAPADHRGSGVDDGRRSSPASACSCTRRRRSPRCSSRAT